MRKINVREARQKIGRLLDAVTTGEEIIITRHGKPVAKLLKVKSQDETISRFPSRQKLRVKLPPSVHISRDLIREIRDERG